MGDGRAYVPVLKNDRDLELSSWLMPSVDEATRRLYEEASPSVVKVVTDSGLGSGFVADKDGRVVTDAHVVQDAREVKVKTRSGEFYRARIEKLDDINDLAVLKLESYKPGSIKPLELGDVTALKPDAKAWALGHPFAVKPVYISPGFLRGPSSPRQMWRQLNPEILMAASKVMSTMSPEEVKDYRDQLSSPLIHARLHIEPGNSGGPLLNEAGKVIGVADFALPTNRSLTYFTPANKVNELLQQKPEEHKFNFTYGYAPADWVSDYKAGWSESPAQNGLYTLGTGYLGYKYFNHMPVSRSLTAKAATVGLGYWGASSLADDYGQFVSATNKADKWKFGIDVGGDTLITAGSLTTIASYLGSVSRSVPRLRTAATIGMGIGVLAKLGSDWIPNRLVLTDIERKDGSYRPPIQQEFVNHLK